MIVEYEPLATGRTTSLFAQDVEDNQREIRRALSRSRVAVIGAAGSIGSSLVKQLLLFDPGELVVIDLNENNLAELVRDLRSSSDVLLPQQFVALPIGLGSREFDRFFAQAGSFDWIFNLSAVKHVRSEKDVFSLMRMIDTNILFLDRFLESLRAGCGKIFSVSTDKATNPASVMGASKYVMERILMKHSDRLPFSTARFANVAFSDGSLLFAFLKRIEKQQPLSAPMDVRRFFMSHEEAGQLCLLSGVLGNNREAFFPKLERGVQEKTFTAIAVELLHKLGYEAYECTSEDEARARVGELVAEKKWPCLFSRSDTSGEKAYEEFFSESDAIDWNRFRAAGVIRRVRESADFDALAAFLAFAERARLTPVSKADYVEAFRQVVPGFEHVEREKNLDQKM